MQITVLAGGYGGARFLAGVRAARPDATITAVVNTADDLVVHGLNVSPDLDTVMYTLGGGLDTERGWGRADEAFRAGEELAAYDIPNTWFGLGDRDLATHLVRTQMLTAGYRLTDVTQALCRRWDPGVTILPMTDERVETHVVIAGDEGGRRAIHFQEWWVRYRAEPRAFQFVPVGIENTRPTAEVLAAVADADVIMVAPSNPVVSIGPILAVPGLADALRSAGAPVVGISPIIAGRHLRGMAEQCLAAIGVEASAAGVAEHYGARPDGLLDGWLVAPQDAPAVAGLARVGIAATAVPLLMSDPAAAAALADEALALAGGLSR